MQVSKFTPALVSAVVTGLESGHSVRSICKRVGISTPTYYKWIAEAEQVNPDQNKVDFRDRVLAAEGQAEQDLLNIVWAKSKKDAKSAQWLLARRFKWSEAHTVSAEAQKELDRLKLAKARAEVEFLEARSEALRGMDTDSDEVLGLLRGIIDHPKGASDPSLEVLRLSKAH
ncbi:MAG: hypothetical protein CMI60_17260 [Parvibaculum sp.]|nr:hypothetical protein [Parvibaculum sp.]